MKTSINAKDALRPKGQCLDGKYLFKQKSQVKKKNKKYTRTQQKMWREKEQKIILNIYPDRGGVPWDLIKAFLHAPTFEH